MQSGPIDFGYSESPANGAGIKRARTALRLFCWDFPKSMQAMDRLRRDDFQNAPFPGIYLLSKDDKRIYIGEAKNVLNRLNQHTINPPERLQNWSRCIVINDGRPATLSDFNDNVIRLALEAHVNHLLKLNGYDVISQSNIQALNYSQKHFVSSLSEEMNFILLKKRIISKLLDDPEKQVVFVDDLMRLFQSKGKTIDSSGAYEAVIDGAKHFIRPGSKKKAGYQITFRGLKDGSFIDSLLKGEGYLVVNRDGVPVIPLSQIKPLIPASGSFDQDTVDIWINFEENRVTLRYTDSIIDVSNFRLVSVVEDDRDMASDSPEGEVDSKFSSDFKGDPEI